MNTKVKTNKLKVHFQYEKLDAAYDVFEISTSEAHFKNSSKILDTPLLHKRVLSVQFLYGKCFYLLLRCNDDNFTTLKTLFENTQEKEMITLRQVNSAQIPQRTLLQLLLNALNEKTHPLLKTSNLTGHYYCFHENFIERKVQGNKNIIWKIKTVEIQIEETTEGELVVSLPVRTFSNLKLSEFFAKGKKDVLLLPQYVIGDNNTLRRKLEKDAGQDTFVMRQEAHKKSNVPFLLISGKDDFGKSKMGILWEVMALFREKYKGLVDISLQEIDLAAWVDHAASTRAIEKKILSSYLDEAQIKLIDEIKTEESALFCQTLIARFQTEFRFKKMGRQLAVAMALQPMPNCFNLRLVRNQAYYEKAELSDPHAQHFADCAVQHITMEDFAKPFKYASQVVVQELMIKQDLINGKITCFNWESLGFLGNFTFYASNGYDETQRYYAMKITPSGVFSIIEIKEDLRALTNENEYILQMKKNKESEQNVYLIENLNGAVNIIRESKAFTIPELNVIQQELSAGNTALRNKGARDEILAGVVDIRYMKKDGKTCYLAGVIGGGMGSSIATSCHLRFVEAFENAPLFFEELLPLMNVSFVRNNQLTVIPFPFKYIREYIKNPNCT